MMRSQFAALALMLAATAVAHPGVPDSGGWSSGPHRVPLTKNQAKAARKAKSKKRRK